MILEWAIRNHVLVVTKLAGVVAQIIADPLVRILLKIRKDTFFIFTVIYDGKLV